MSWRRRAAWIGAGVALTLLVAGGGYFLLWSSAIESWVSAQLLKTSAAYLDPELRFGSLEYQGPRTILLTDLTLSSPDPANPGQSVAVLVVKRARLELTEIPRSGKPITFSEVLLENPEIHLIARSPGAAALVGFSSFLKGSTDPPAPGRAAEPGPMKPSDFLLLRHVEITEGTVSYDSQRAGFHPIWLDGINVNLFFTPGSTSSSPGLYSVATTISRKPAFDLELKGSVNIDTFLVELAKLEVMLDLREKYAHVLPPELQKILQRHEVTGQLQMTAAGTLPVYNWRQGTLQSKGELTGARAALGQNRLAIGSWSWQVDVAGGTATIRKADAKLLGGELHLDGTIPLDGTHPARLSLRTGGLQLQQLLRSTDRDGLPLYAGLLAANVTYSAPLLRWDEQASGKGTLSIRKGRIDTLPVFGRILASVNNLLKFSRGSSRHDLADTADTSFSFAGDRLRIDHFVFASGALGLRGHGTIGFDGQLDLRLNGGPMENLQDSMGVIGEAWATITDSMAGYRLSGTLDNPQVALEIGRSPH